MATRRLGRGLSALIPEMSATPAVANKESLIEIETALISPNPFQPRLDFEPEALQALKNSISENGLVTPITVRPLGDEYQLIAGERRLRSVQELGYEKIPAYILNVQSDEEMLELSLVENIQRENLNPIEEALGYQRLIEECQLTQEEAARKVGKDRATVANFLRLLKLPDKIRESVKRSEISAGHARAILTCATTQRMLEVWSVVLKKGLSVRQAEKLSRETKTPQKKSPPSRKERQNRLELDEIEDKIRQVFATQVRVVTKGGKGTIELDFYDENDFERIVEKLLKSM